MVRPNFRGERIPVSYGIVILLWCVPVFSGLALLLPDHRRELGAHLVVAIMMGLLGFVDDRWGDRTRTGLKGHLRAFFVEGVVTTGFAKAVGGGLVALAAPRFLLHLDWPDSLLDGAIIALTANALNLLDLRPGRAGAVFLLLSAILIAVQWTAGVASPLVFVTIPALVVYERDARAKVMMGDSGSNLLGGTLGLTLVTTCPSLGVRLTILALLVALHVLAERASITQIIERNSILRRLDRLTGVR
jgi:UDP-N-acetylmuramyl pentapeptide phosphotransferase/UDP-N-acetylglucosamine-1-phosphate transferase